MLKLSFVAKYLRTVTYLCDRPQYQQVETISN